MEDIIYLRPSGINAYRECSAKYYFQNVERIQVPNKLALAFGTSVHRVLQQNYTQKIATRQDITIEEAKDIFSQIADDEFSSVDPVDFTEEKPGQVKDAGLELIEKYQKEVAYRIQPAAVEQKIQVKFKGYDYGLTGTIDLVDEDNFIIDHKTTGKEIKSIPDSYQLQVGGAYPLLYRSLKGCPAGGARTDFLIRKSLKNNTTNIRTLKIDIDEGYFLNVFQTVGTAIAQGIFIPNRNHSYCSKKYCKYAGFCENKFGGKVRA